MGTVEPGVEGVMVVLLIREAGELALLVAEVCK